MADTKKLDYDHYGLICDWLEILGNFPRLNGSGTRREVVARHLSKKTTYGIMLLEMQEFGYRKWIVIGECLGKRFKQYHHKYKEAL